MNSDKHREAIKGAVSLLAATIAGTNPPGAAWVSVRARLDELRALVDGAPPSAIEKFSATHQHAEGGLYQVIGGPLKIHTAKDTWEPAVRYRNIEGYEFARTLSDFDARFVRL